MWAMSRIITNHNCIRKAFYFFIAAGLIAGLAFYLMPPNAVQATSQGKVYVCKYVGKPGADERLQTGQNPIEVSVNTIPQPVVIGSYFPDAQGRSYVLGFVPMDPEPSRESCPPPNLPENGSASVTTGVCSWTEAEGSLTVVMLELLHASLTIHGVTYTTSQTINLPPGNYPYTWIADPGFIGSGSGIVVVGDCTPGTATASVDPGACTWTQAEGSMTQVFIEVTHATLTIHGVTYATSQIIILPPGSYPYTWAADSGYIGNGSGTIIVGDCSPGTASASITTGVCNWTQSEGSQTPVSIYIDHALLTINGMTYNSSQTINLPPGSYPYNWTAVNGYSGNGSGTLVVGDCTPGTASASLTTGVCSWTQTTGSITPVTVELENASLTIDGLTYITSQTINLTPGTYPYSWTAVNGYTGNGSGTIVIGDCTPGSASASVTAGPCSWTPAMGSETPVTIQVNHAFLVINSITYTSSVTISLPPGSYPYSWMAETGYVGNGSGSIVIGDCTPGSASASVTTGVCSWSQATGSLTPIIIDVEHASLTINNVTYSSSQTVNLTPGSYPYSWTAQAGYAGSGSGTVVIGDCTPGTAAASLTTGSCSWSQASGSLTPVTLDLNHASLTINGTIYNSSQTINLPPGSYPYSWTADSGYTGNGSGVVVIGGCVPGMASVSVTTGMCQWTQAAGSLTPVTLDLTHASLTINGMTYSTSQIINLSPGSYPYSWTAESGFTGNGNGTLVITGCAPGTASATLTTGACHWTESGGSFTYVSIALEHASLLINGTTYIFSQTISLSPGDYPYNWIAETGYIGNGSGTIVIGDCTPGTSSAALTVGSCSWSQTAGSLTPVTLDVNNASLTINGMAYVSSQTIKLPPGSYPYSWIAINGYTGSGNGTLEIGSCLPLVIPEIASASVTAGICTWGQMGGSLAEVFIQVNHASLTMNGVTYTTSQTITLPPGNYPYSWLALSGYSGNGSGVLVIRDCPPMLMPVSGVDKEFLKHNLSDSFFSLSLDNALESFNIPTQISKSRSGIDPAVILAEKHPYAGTQASQLAGLIPDRLVIPIINLDAPIVPVGYQELAYGGKVIDLWLAPEQYAAGWQATSAFLGDPGNTVLNGHHNAFGMVFKDLYKLKRGDALRVFSGSVEFRYQVVSNLLLPERYESLSSRLENAYWIEPTSDERITLVTCWPENSNTHRVVIVARPMDNPDQPPSP
jgi:LPXTG-site transpeptidase (sortase) family protein